MTSNPKACPAYITDTLLSFVRKALSKVMTRTQRQSERVSASGELFEEVFSFLSFCSLKPGQARLKVDRGEAYMWSRSDYVRGDSERASSLSKWLAWLLTRKIGRLQDWDWGDLYRAIAAVNSRQGQSTHSSFLQFNQPFSSRWWEAARAIRHSIQGCFCRWSSARRK